MRLALGGFLLLIFAIVRKELRLDLPWRTTILAALFVALYQISFFSGVKLTGVAAGTMVGIGSAPVFAGLLDWLARGEKPGRRWVVATALAISGCFLLISAQGEFSVNGLGILLAIGAGGAYAAYTLFSRNLLETHSPENVMAVVFCLGALLLMPILLRSDLSWLAQPRGILIAFHLGVIATGLAYILFGRGLQTTSVAAAVTLTLAEPLTAGLLGVFLLGERLNPFGWVGVILIFSGLAVLTAQNKK